MRKRLFNQQSEPRSREAQKTWRLSVKAKIMMALLALMLIPQGAWAQGDVDYMWYDTSTGKFVKSTVTSGNYTTLTGNSSASLADGTTYVVSGSETINARLDVSGTVNIILCDGATFTARKGITVSTGDVLNIYAQSEGTGKLIAYGFDDTKSQGTLYAAIGDAQSGLIRPSTPADYGVVNIYGGQITADASSIAGASGIGAFDYTKSCVTTIYGGNVDAMGGPNNTTATYGIANLKLGSGVDYYGSDSPNPATNSATSVSGPQSPLSTLTVSTLYRYMSTKEKVYDLAVGGKQVRRTNANDILFSGGTTPTASFDAATNTLALDGLSITSGNATIVSGLNDLTVEFANDSELGDNGGNDGNIQSTNANATLKFKGKISGTKEGNLILHANNTNAVVQGFKSVSYEDAYWNYSEPITYDEAPTQLRYESRDGNSLTYVRITTTRQYLLWMGATQVSDDNNGNILGDITSPTASYNANDNILTLDNCNFHSMDGLMCGLGSLTIILKGHNNISADSYSGYSPLYSSVSGATLKIEKAAGENNCSLVLGTYDGTPYTSVVNVNGFGSIIHTGLDFVVTKGNGTTLTDNTIYGATLRSLSFSGGDGTSNNPYLIATKEDLKELATVVNNDVLDTSGKYFTVSDNIDCAGLTFTPIAWTVDHAFRGTFDGNGKTISNLQVEEDCVGLFGYVYNGTISNLTLLDCTIIGDNQYRDSYAGALAGTVDGTSSISNVKVTGTSAVSVKIPNGANNGYAGAIFGNFKNGTLLNNYYEYTVTVTGDDAVAKTGYTPRGDGVVIGDIAISDGAVLYTQTLSTATVANGTIVPWPIPSNTYTNNGKFPPGQTAYFKVTPSTGYAIDASSPKVTYTTATGASQTINGVLEANESSDGVNVYSFTMPDATDATATASLLVNISDAVYSAAIDPVTYSPTGSLAPTTVKLTPKGGTTITLSNTGTNNDFTITGIVDHSGNPVTEFTKADTYKVTIQGQGSYTGTKANIGYTIEQAQVAITQAPTAIAGLTYDGSLHNLVNPGTVTGGTMKYSLDYNAAIADWTTTVPQGKNATDSPYNVYYMVEGDANYIGVAKSTNNKVEVTISPKTISNANTVISLNSSSFVYSSSSSQQPSITSVSVDNTLLTETQDYVATIPSGTDVNTYTVTITGNGNYTGNATTTFNITLAPITPSVSITGWTYGSAANTPTVTGNPGNGSVLYEYKKSTDADSEYSRTVPTAAGTYTVRATIAATANYQGGTATANFTIDQATLTSVEIDQTQFVYDPTKERVVNVTKVMAGTLEVPVGSYEIVSNSNKATDRGTHTVTVQGKAGSNFKGTASTTFVITERTVNIDFGGRTFRTFYDANEPFLVPDNMTAYIVTGVSGNAVTTKKVSYIQAGVPVLLEKTPGTTNVVDPAESYVGNKLKYAAAATPATEKHYVLYNNEFVRASGTINGKVYLDLTGYSGGARTLVIGDGTTAVEGIVSEDDDAKWYDMQGRRINKPTKSGLYIKDGKKVVVKTRY